MSFLIYDLLALTSADAYIQTAPLRGAQGKLKNRYATAQGRTRWRRAGAAGRAFGVGHTASSTPSRLPAVPIAALDRGYSRSADGLHEMVCAGR